MQVASGVSRLGGGLNTLDLDDFNVTMQQQGLSKFSETAPALYLSKTYIVRRFVMESELDALLWKTRTDSALSSSLFSGWWGMNWGLSLLPKGGVLLVYPCAGIAIGGMRLHVHEPSGSFGQVLNEEPYDVSMWQGKFLVSVGVNADLVVHFPKKGYRTVGIRAGYMYDPAVRSEWNASGVDVKSGPSPSMTGAYVRFTLGRYHRGLSPWSNR